ncbi:MAG TPA: class I SAM-dependent RNA methyltransferase [Ktedonobacterales bacterium]|nr:class I SAM-dependent RNA methyltransferase [Ktedonobacterales bacterium]
MDELIQVPPTLPEHEPPRVRCYHVSLIGWTREGEALGRVIAELPGDTVFPVHLPLPVDRTPLSAHAGDAAEEAGSALSQAGDVAVPFELRVPAGIPGEQVIVSVEEPPLRPHRRKRHRRRLPPRISIVQVLEASPWRVAAPCPVFGSCGGCQLQHVAYPQQLEIKRQMVTDLLRSEGGFADPPVLPTLGCEPPWRYRNHMRFSVNREGQVGLTARGTHRVLPLNDCPIAHAQINRALKVLAESPQPRPQALVRCGAHTGQMMIQPAPAPELREQLAAAGLEVCDESMEEALAGQRFRIRPSSFFQTNTAQAEHMAVLVMRGLALRPEMTVVDAFCGVGTFALLLAPHARRVIGIEESASAVRDALWNAREAANVQIIQGKTEAILPGLAESMDGLVLDPPRQGCQRPVLDALVERRVPRVVYVSCDPATLARDLKYLCQTQAAYELVEAQPLDMFPQTAHIECVAVLQAR